jgi:hypothetical protein
MQAETFVQVTTERKMQEEPLIYTSKGNLPISSLTYRHEWLEDDVAITFVEEYSLNGEIVKKSAHARLKKGLDAAIQNQLFGTT